MNCGRQQIQQNSTLFERLFRALLGRLKHFFRFHRVHIYSIGYLSPREAVESSRGLRTSGLLLRHCHGCFLTRCGCQNGGLTDRLRLRGGTHDVINDSNSVTKNKHLFFSPGGPLQQTQNYLESAECNPLQAQKSTTPTTEVTEKEWADASGLSVIQLRRVMQQGNDAREALVAANVGLVTSIAKKFSAGFQHNNRGSSSLLTLQDLIQEGNLGMMQAAERFEPERGVRFGTYATWWIRQRIAKSISDSSRMIRLPAHVHSKLQKIKKAKAAITAQTGRNLVTVQELSHYLEMPVKKVQLYSDCARHTLSLESPLQCNNAMKDHAMETLGDTLAASSDADGGCPTETLEVAGLHDELQKVMESELTTQERNVLVQRFGLGVGKAATMEETATLLNISRDRVRLLETRALHKLRHPQCNYKLKEYMTTTSSTTRRRGGDRNRYAPYQDHKVEADNKESKTTPNRMWF